jgi:hypothetical protein
VTPQGTEVPFVIAGTPAPGHFALFDLTNKEAAEIYTEAGIPVAYVVPAVGLPGSWGLRTLGVTPVGIAPPVIKRTIGGQVQYSADFGLSWTDKTGQQYADGARESAFGLGMLAAAALALLMLGGKLPKFFR